MGTPSEDSEEFEVDLSDHLKVDEDDELRRLNYLWDMRLLSEPSKERLVELRLRDRRRMVRRLRALGDEEEPEEPTGPI